MSEWAATDTTSYRLYFLFFRFGLRTHAHLDSPRDHFFFCQVLVPVAMFLIHIDVGRCTSAFGHSKRLL